ncbi:MAG: response regulator transcription factor [Pseudomonadota bacterium]
MRILIIEDNHDLLANLCEYLEDRGHTVDAAEDGLTGLHLAVCNTYDAILLDVILPGLNGFTVCRKLREEAGRDTPILMLTARDSVEDRVAGLEAGADDYVIKPFALREVEARLRALVRRATGHGQLRCLRVADLTFDTGTLKVTRGDRTIELTPIALRILEHLMKNAPRLVTRGDLEALVWGDSPPDSEAALRVHLHALRSAIDHPGQTPLLHTVRGRGYRLAGDDAV